MEKQYLTMMYYLTCVAKSLVRHACGYAYYESALTGFFLKRKVRKLKPLSNEVLHGIRNATIVKFTRIIIKNHIDVK